MILKNNNNKNRTLCESLRTRDLEHVLGGAGPKAGEEQVQVLVQVPAPSSGALLCPAAERSWWCVVGRTCVPCPSHHSLMLSSSPLARGPGIGCRMAGTFIMSGPLRAPPRDRLTKKRTLIFFFFLSFLGHPAVWLGKVKITSPSQYLIYLNHRRLSQSLFR